MGIFKKRIEYFNNVDVEWYKESKFLFIDDPKTGETLATFKVKLSS